MKRVQRNRFTVTTPSGKKTDERVLTFREADRLVSQGYTVQVIV